ncbi:MAG TPA: hypothetical protein VKX96_05505 [Chloroflexota bacterium]|nr:hypothetical protein [Chloroflexota bacterium]
MVAETRIVAAAYPHHGDAQAAVRELRDAGFPEDAISIIYTDPGHLIKAGLVDGAVWGGVIGGLVGLLFPPVGLLIVAGPIVGALTSGATLAAAGAMTVAALEGVIAGLVSLGMPQDVATRLGQHVHKGDALVIAHAVDETSADKAHRILEAHHPRPEGAPETGGIVAVSPKQ